MAKTTFELPKAILDKFNVDFPMTHERVVIQGRTYHLPSLTIAQANHLVKIGSRHVKEKKPSSNSSSS